MTQQSCPDASPCTSPSAESAGSRRFRQPPAWGTWVLGLIFLLDVPVVLLLAFFMWWAVTDNAPDIPPGCSFMNPCPSTPGSVSVRSSSASGRSCSGLSSSTPSTVFYSPVSMLADPLTLAVPRLLSLPRCSWGCRQSYCAYCLIGAMVAHWFRNSFGVSGVSNPTRTFSRRFSPRSTLRTSLYAPAISHTPTRVLRRPSVRQIADHVTLLFCEVCKTEAEAQ